MIRQIALDLRWSPHQRLDAFWPGANPEALRAVSAVAEGRDGGWLYLQGASGTGKSHLLIGACRAVLGADRPARYVSLAAAPPPRADAVAGLDAGGLLALDDLQAIAGDGASERALFDLYDRGRAVHARMLFAAVVPPAGLGLGLPDLASRLAACTQYALHALDDAGRRAMLRLLAGRLGLRLSDEVLDWWLAHQPRDPASLVATLRRVDRAALAAQRRVTVAFLRELLADR